MAAFLGSPLASGITGSVVYVDKGYHAMGKQAEPAVAPLPRDASRDRVEQRSYRAFRLLAARAA